MDNETKIVELGGSFTYRKTLYQQGVRRVPLSFPDRHDVSRGQAAADVASGRLTVTDEQIKGLAIEDAVSAHGATRAAHQASETARLAAELAKARGETPPAPGVTSGVAESVAPVLSDGAPFTPDAVGQPGQPGGTDTDPRPEDMAGQPVFSPAAMVDALRARGFDIVPTGAHETVTLADVFYALGDPTTRAQRDGEPVPVDPDTSDAPAESDASDAADALEPAAPSIVDVPPPAPGVDAGETPAPAGVEPLTPAQDAAPDDAGAPARTRGAR